jgi:hypothetical protein
MWHKLARVLLLVVSSPLTAAPPPPGDAGLARGIKLVEQGDYAQAIILLDGTARRLDGKVETKKVAAQAFLYLGVAYVGENQETLARAAFRDALARDAALNLSAFDISPKVRDLFQKAKDELATQRVAATSKKGRSKAPWIILGVLGAGGGAAAAIAGGGGGTSTSSSTTPGETSVFPAAAGCNGTSNTSTTAGFPPVPPGSTVRLSEGRTVSITYSITLPCSAQGVSEEVAFVDPSSRICFLGESPPFDAQQGLPVTGIVVTVPLTAASSRCSAPFTVSTIHQRARGGAGTLALGGVISGSGFQVVP